MPERYSPWKTVYQRFRYWRDDGTFERILARLHLKLRQDGYLDLDTWMIDSTTIRATRAASGGGKNRGLDEPLDHAWGRSRGTTLHLLCDSQRFPLTFTLSPGQQADSQHFIHLLEQVRLPGTRGRPRKRCRRIVADKGYDSETLRRYYDRVGIQPVIARRKMRRKPRPGLPRLFDQPMYRQRNAIERLFSRLKEKRRLCTRFDKLASSFKAMVTLPCTDHCWRIDFSDKP